MAKQLFSYTQKSLREQVVAILAEDSQEEADRVSALFDVQESEREQQYLESLEASPKAQKALRAGMVGLLEKAIAQGPAGVRAAQTYGAKANVELYESRPMLFDRFNQKPFGGSKTLEQCRAWLEGEGLHESLTSVFQMFSSCMRNISRTKNYEQANEDFKVLLEEIKSELSEE